VSHAEQRRASWLPWAIAAASAALIGASIVISFFAGSEDAAFDFGGVFFSLAFVAFGVVGALVASRQPGNLMGWLFLVMSLATGLQLLADGYARVEPRLPGFEWAAWFANWAWVVGLAGLPFVLLLFPSGRLLSRRWRPVVWINGAALAVLALSQALSPTFADYPGIRNPIGVELFAADPLEDGGVGWIFLLVGMVASAASLVVRFRRARGDDHQQLKWLAYAAGLIGAGWIPITFGWWAEGIAGQLVLLPFMGALLFLPIAVGIAILRHRLYDIDVVINRTLVYGALAAFIGVVYVAVVVGVGQLVGRAGEPNLALSIAATALVAVAFHPLRERLQRVVNRVVYGARASPYEVLSGFSDRVGGTYDTEDVLPRMARIVAEGTASARADVWLRVGGQLVRAASWPESDVAGPGSMPIRDGQVPALDGGRSVPVRHQGDLLGALAVTKRPGETLTPTENALLSDLAAQAGLVLRNVRLTAELRARLEELSRQAALLRESRERIVETQDAERRRLERNIHDGAQQHLVALAVKLRLARTMAERDPARARTLVGEARTQTVDTLRTLRDLASGIYPPVLAERGLAAALREGIGRLELPVDLSDDGIDRYPIEAEAAAYFSILESLQNVAKHANASRVSVWLAEQNGHLVFGVEDDGMGFDPSIAIQGSGLSNLADRVEALGGTLEIRSAPGAGTTVSGRVPVVAREEAAR
jgi:signal transduction histidine kinase